MIKFLIAIVAFAVTAPAVARASAIEDIARIINPYTKCEAVGRANLNLAAHNFQYMTLLSKKNPGDPKFKEDAEHLSREIESQKKQIVERCNYESIQSSLRARIQKLQPKLSTSDVYWLASNLFILLNSVNQQLIDHERGLIALPTEVRVPPFADRSPEPANAPNQ